MKKKLFLSSALFLSASLLTLSCSNSNKSQDTQSETEQEEATPQIDFAKLYEEAITFKAGDVTEKEIPEDLYKKLSQPIDIKNNTAINFSSNDYIITYEYEQEDMVNDYLEVVTRLDSISGPDLASNSSVNVVIKQEGFCLKNPSVKLTISLEEFEKRYKELSK